MYLVNENTNKKGEKNMGKQLNYLDEQTYFHYFERKYTHPVFVKNYPLIAKRMRQLCETIKEKIQKVTPKQFFQVHAEILGMDAQLQILLSLADLVGTNAEISEEIIIQCAQEDYPVFMRELCENSEHNFLEHTLYFSVI